MVLVLYIFDGVWRKDATDMMVYLDLPGKTLNHGIVYL